MDELSPSGVDGNDLTASSTHEEDPVETFSQDLKEFHVCMSEVKRHNLTLVYGIYYE